MFLLKARLCGSPQETELSSVVLHSKITLLGFSLLLSLNAFQVSSLDTDDCGPPDPPLTAECPKREVYAVIHPFRAEGDQPQSCCRENDPSAETRHRHQKQAVAFPELPSLVLRSLPTTIFLSLF